MGHLGALIERLDDPAFGPGTPLARQELGVPAEGLGRAVPGPLLAEQPEYRTTFVIGGLRRRLVGS